MNKTLLRLGLATLLLNPITFTFAQPKLVQTVSKKSNELNIPFEKYVLPNGLTILLHEDHSDPIVHVDVTYHVGSAREEIGKSGFAHFFEHMMFQGSDNVGDEQHFKIITEAGGTLNGTTNRDRTNYFETVPANQLEKMLWLESDRMGFLLDAVTQEKFEIQRSTVKNERGQRYDNQPYGLLGEVSAKNLYPYGHPYSWLTIGYIEDLDRVNVGDLKNFFLRWYGPNNAVLTIGGDFDKKQVLAWIDKYFGSIPKGPEVTPATFPLPVLANDRYVTMMDNYAKVNMMKMVFPTPPRYSKEEPAIDLLAQIIGQGKSSILYKKLVKTGLATNVSVYNSTTELAGEFSIQVSPFPGKNLAEIEKIVRESFEEFEKTGATDEDVKKYVSQIEASTVFGLESVNSKVSELAALYTFLGDANQTNRLYQENLSVTKADVMNAYNKFIKNKHSLTVSVVTKNDPNNVCKPQNYNVEEVNNFKQNYGYDGLTYNKAKDNFDRSQVPATGEAIVVKAPKFWKGKVVKSFDAIGSQTDEIPVVNLILSFKGGEFLDPNDKVGTAALFGMMMNEDTKNYTAEAFSTALSQLGSSISVSTGNDKVNVQVRSLHKNLDATLALLEERLLNTVFNQDDLDRIQKRLAVQIKNSKNIPANVASSVFEKLSYDPTALMSRSVDENTIMNIKLEDIKSYYENNFSRNGASLVVVGDISKKEITNKLAFLSKIQNKEINLPTKELIVKPSRINTKNTIYLIDFPKAAQTEFRIGKLNDVTYSPLGASYNNTIMNYPLGGAFNSRLNLYLREEKGWTYGARSGFSANKYNGAFNFSGGMKAEPTDSALTDVLRIINQYKQEGATAEELAFTKNALSQSEALKYETGFQKAGFLSGILNYKLPANYTSKQNKMLNNMTLEQLNAIAQKGIPNNEDYIILLVGDKALIAEEIKAKGFTIIELDKDGKVITK